VRVPRAQSITTVKALDEFSMICLDYSNMIEGHFVVSKNKIRFQHGHRVFMGFDSIIKT